MRRLLALFVVAVSLLVPVAPATSQAAGCSFHLGFAALAAMIPADVGACVEDENHNPLNGDGLQHTTGGLLVWRKADNWTAFTNGYETWINGPQGLQKRRNEERFPWEAPASAQARFMKRCRSYSYEYPMAPWHWRALRAARTAASDACALAIDTSTGRVAPPSATTHAAR